MNILIILLIILIIGVFVIVAYKYYKFGISKVFTDPIYLRAPNVQTPNIKNPVWVKLIINTYYNS